MAMEMPARDRLGHRLASVLRSRATLIVAVMVLVAATITGPTVELQRMSVEDLDTALGLAEFVVFPLSLLAAGILVAIGRRGTFTAAVALLAVCGLTICQPFGVVAHPIPASRLVGDASAGGVLTGWFPPLRIHTYRRATECINHDGGCDGDTDVMVRSWIAPGLLDDAVDVSPWAEHDQAPRLARTTGGATALIVAPDEAYRLGYGITSTSGEVYWLIAAALIAAGYVRRRYVRRHQPPATDAPLW